MGCAVRDHKGERGEVGYHNLGKNVLAGTDSEKIVKGGKKALEDNKHPERTPKFCDGKTADRVVNVILDKAGKKERFL